MVSSCSHASAPKRPRPSESELKVTLKIKSQDGNEGAYKVGLHVPLKKLFMFYCSKKNLDLRTVRFVYNSFLLNPKHTPAKLMMENDDQIDAFMEQPGGGFYHPST